MQTDEPRETKRAWVRYLVVQPNITEDFLAELEHDKTILLNNLHATLKKGNTNTAAQLVGAIDFLNVIRQAVIGERDEQMALAQYKGEGSRR